MQDEDKYKFLLDKNDPNSLINRIPTMLRTPMLAVPEEIWDTPFNELERKIEGKYVKELRLLRTSLWNEYIISEKRASKQINGGNMWKGSGLSHTMIDKLSHNSYYVAYILTPPPDYRIAIKEMFQLGLEQMRDMLTKPHTKDGRLDAAAANVKLKIINMILEREAPVTQQIESKTLQVTATATEMRQIEEKDLDQRIKELEASATKSIEGQVINDGKA